jgi:hypothetical protein
MKKGIVLERVIFHVGGKIELSGQGVTYDTTGMEGDLGPYAIIDYLMKNKDKEVKVRISDKWFSFLHSGT